MWIAAICFLIAFLLQRSIANDNKKEGVLVRDTDAIYIGGFSDVKGGGKAHIKVKEDVIEVMFGGIVINNYKSIPMDVVTNAEIKTETQITSEIGLGKLVVFGMLAFAMKDKKSVVKNYLAITCNRNGSEASIIFESFISERIVREIRKIKGINSTF